MSSGDPAALAVMIRQQCEELQRKNDKDNYARAVKGFTEMLKEFAPEKLPAGSQVLLAQCYSNLGEHKRAAAALGASGRCSAAEGQVRQVGEQLLAAGDAEDGGSLGVGDSGKPLQGIHCVTSTHVGVLR